MENDLSTILSEEKELHPNCSFSSSEQKSCSMKNGIKSSEMIYSVFII